MELNIRPATSMGPGASPVEVVERKGIGHPDSICDAIAERVCVQLCQYYLERFGVILHHNVDKVLLCAGRSEPAFAAGRMIEPLEIYIAGRATSEHAGVKIPVHEIAVEACRHWLRAHLRYLDVDHDVRVVSRLRPGSRDLNWLFSRCSDAALANDTSCGAGFSPLTDLERVVFAAERGLNDARTKQTHPALGEDVKVMGVRRHGLIELTISCALLGRHLADINDYRETKHTAATLAAEAARRVSTLPVNATVNVSDDIERGDIFLTVTGTSAEAGDDGQTGRGNRVCGLITPYRVTAVEGAAGKNPVSHTGKLYNILAPRIATAITTEMPEVHDVACVLVSRIGQRIDDPQLVDVALSSTAAVHTLQRRASELVHTELGTLRSLREELLGDRITLF